MAKNNIGDFAAQRIRTALKNGQCPDVFYLDLSDNAISSKDISLLAEALGAESSKIFC